MFIFKIVHVFCLGLKFVVRLQEGGKLKFFSFNKKFVIKKNMWIIFIQDMN